MALNIKALLPWREHPWPTDPIKDMASSSTATESGLSDHPPIAQHYDSPIKPPLKPTRSTQANAKKKLNIISSK